MINFENIHVGNKYSRPTLAELWGYKSHNAISRGVISPKGMNTLILFVTKEKQESLTQYKDHIDSDILFWEGEKGHGNDKRITERMDQIHVFYREKHHIDFTYEGRAVLRSFNLLSDRPSKFTFELIDKRIAIENIVTEIQMSYGIPETEKSAIINSRIGQGLYRRRALDLWKTCSVTGFTNEKILNASHIKPWKLADNNERLSPYNSLLLIPTLDKLFDKGYIGFERNGKIMLSNKVDQQDWERVGVNTNLQLRVVPEETKKYLDYHSEYIYDLIPS